VHLLEAFSARELAAAPLQAHALVVHGTSVNQDGRSSSLTARPTRARPRLAAELSPQARA